MPAEEPTNRLHIFRTLLLELVFFCLFPRERGATQSNKQLLVMNDGRRSELESPNNNNSVSSEYSFQERTCFISCVMMKG